MSKRAGWVWVLVVSAVVSFGASAQSNVIQGTDVSLGVVDNLINVTHNGTYPNGVQTFAMDTTSCNLGTVNVPWLAASPGPLMQENHPLIAFIACREKAGRFQQISDYSYLKHGFYALSNSQCTPCQNPSNGTFLGVGCSDTYASSNNSDDYWLAPPNEVNPWLGTWSRYGTHFDRGQTTGVGATPAAQQTDGIRSLLSTSWIPAPGNAMHIKDADLNNAASSYYYGAQYVINGEPELNRNNNIASRAFAATWLGTYWLVNLAGTGTQVQGTILQRWSGATVTSGANLPDDGRVYVAVKVTGPTNGIYHYEYAFHNRDNNRGIKAVHIPLSPLAQVSGFGFSDVDAVAANNWTMTVANNAINVTTLDYATDPNANRLRWNSIFNVWFDTDAVPVTNTAATLDEFAPGTGASSFPVLTTVPGALYNVNLGPGCSGTATVPKLFITGTPPRATLGNNTFTVSCTGAAGNGPLTLFFSALETDLAINSPCHVYLGGTYGMEIIPFDLTANVIGNATLPIPIPNNPMYEGITIAAQFICTGTNGAYFGYYNLSNGLRIRLGSNISPTP